MTRLEHFRLTGWTVLRIRKHALFATHHNTLRRVSAALARPTFPNAHP